MKKWITICNNIPKKKLHFKSVSKRCQLQNFAEKSFAKHLWEVKVFQNFPILRSVD